MIALLKKNEAGAMVDAFRRREGVSTVMVQA